MSNKFLIPLAVLAAIVMAVLIYNTVNYAVYSPGDATLIGTSADPVQMEDTTTTLPPLQIRGSRFYLDVKAQYKLSGILVGRHLYPRGLMKDLSPYDYAVAWGQVIEWLPHIRFSQANRYCFFKYKIPSPVNKAYLETHMSNNHMIPSTPNLRHALRTAKKHVPVQIEGYLVNVQAQLRRGRTGTWNSSLKREDTGNGACEIIYVTRLQIGDRIYE
jgi:hypothetical protein